MPFFEFTQNNSGGSFTVNEKLCHRLFIEAPTPNVANGIAEDLGIYFDGCDEGSDCPCCGDRWYKAGTPEKIPLYYGGMSKQEAEGLSKRYGIEMRQRKKPTDGRYFDGKRPFEVVFPTLEIYAQYLADHYGWTKPDCRIFYASGRVVEIFSEKDKDEKIQDNATSNKGRRRKRNKANARRP